VSRETLDQPAVPTAEAPGIAFDPAVVLAHLTHRPGVYRMLDAAGTVIYVGKARDLKRRVTSYFQGSRAHDAKTIAMVRSVAGIEVTVTRTEVEALMLEYNLIKEHRPRFNVMLRDDKSYPYVLLTDEPWPRLAFHRGGRALPGRYFGPYPGAGAVRETLGMMHKLFKLRSCEDSVFRNRSRPCLQYQIGRCTAPCVGLVAAREYADSVRRATLFLEGRSDDLARELGDAMEAASARLTTESSKR
jgi:excinuclease ABC subunit C